MKQMVFYFLIFSAFGALGCASPPSGLAENEIRTAQNIPGESAANVPAETKFRVETFAVGLEVPWAFAFLPERKYAFYRASGQSQAYRKRKAARRAGFRRSRCRAFERERFDGHFAASEFPENNFVYLAYAYRGDGKRVRVVRYKFADNKFVEPKTIIENIPAAPNHAGTRARFGPGRQALHHDGRRDRLEIWRRI